MTGLHQNPADALSLPNCRACGKDHDAMDCTTGVQPNYEPFDEEDAPPAPPLFYTVAIYDTNRAYGGPEEGGWWYDCGTLVAHIEAPRIFTDKDEACAYAREVNARLDTEHNNPRGYRADLSSVCCEGRYAAQVCDGYPSPHYPAVRPHYE